MFNRPARNAAMTRVVVLHGGLGGPAAVSGLRSSCSVQA